MATVSQFMRRADRGLAVRVPHYPLPLETTLVGIEVEVDQDSTTTATFPVQYDPEWQQKSDGSLSNGYEYVLSAPLSGQQMVQAVHKLYQGETKMGRTYTGSTHIHVDMTDNVDLDALRTLVLLTYAFENILYASGDMSRQWCGYANRLTSAPSDMIEAILTLEDYSGFRSSIINNSRYYGLNLQALTKFGSVEFRYFPTAESAEELLRWVKLVLLFKKAAQEIGTVDKLIEILGTEEGYNDFIATYFSEFPAEVEATSGYEKIKSLMTKALIISKTTRTGHKRYAQRLLTGKFKNVVDRGRRKLRKIKLPKGFKLNILHLAMGQRRAVGATEAVASYTAEHGEAPSLTILMLPSGEVYYAKSRGEYYEWWYVYDMYGDDPDLMDSYRASLPYLAEYCEAHADEVNSNMIANLEGIASSFDERSQDDEEF